MISVLLDAIQKQTKQLEAFAGLQQQMQEAVLAQEWEALDTVMRKLNGMAAQLESLEKEREQAASRQREEYGLKKDAPLSEMLIQCEAEERKKLVRAHRALQVAVMKVKGITGGLDSYLRGAVRTNKAVLDQIFPDQRGTLYSSRGRREDADGRAMVLDRKL